MIRSLRFLVRIDSLYIRSTLAILVSTEVLHYEFHLKLDGLDIPKCIR